MDRCKNRHFRFSGIKRKKEKKCNLALRINLPSKIWNKVGESLAHKFDSRIDGDADEVAVISLEGAANLLIQPACLPMTDFEYERESRCLPPTSLKSY